MGLLFAGATLGLLVEIGLFAAAVAEYAAASRWVGHTLEVRHAADAWVNSLLDAETGARGFIIAGQAESLESHSNALELERARADALRALVTDNPAQTENVLAAARDARAVIDRQRETTALVRLGHREEAVLRFGAGDSKGDMEAFRADVERIRQEEDRLLVERNARARAGAATAVTLAVFLALISCGFLVLAWRLQRTRETSLQTLAGHARSRLGKLSDLAVALAGARTRAQVADLVVDVGMRAVGADTCTLYMLDGAGTALDLVADRGVAREIVDKIRHISESTGNRVTYETFRAGTTLWAESQADYDALFPALSSTKASGDRAKAFWSVPLVAEGHSVGLLGMGFYEERKFTTDERAFVETLTNQCAQALLRASRLEGEDAARRWFTTTLRSIGDAVIATDAEGRITFMNPVAERLTGWAESEARDKPLDEVFRIFSERTGALAESPVAKVLREGTVVGLANHTVLRPKSGLEIPIDDSGAPIRSEGGRMLGVVMVFRDVTREKAERVRGEFLANAAEVLISSVDYNGILASVARLAVPTLADWCSIDILEPGSTTPRQAAVAHVDPTKVRFARELGERYPPDRSATRGAPEVIRSGKAELYEEIPAALLDGAARDAEHLRLIRELSLKSAMVVPLRGRDRTLGAMTFVHAESGRRYTDTDLRFAADFAHRAALAIENARAVKEVQDARTHERELRGAAEMASRAKDEFLAMVSHELRTPLTAILGWAVMLRERGPTTDVERGLAVIERNARSQTKLIEDVLDVSRIISGKLSLSIGPTSIEEVVTAAIETAMPAASAKDIAIVPDVPSPAPTITADAGRLQQVVWNLLANAVKFTPKGGKVGVHASRQGSDVLIRVRDTGEGIRSDALPFVFEPFRQADASTTRRHGGLGLGLAIVRQLVSAHGGTVRAESEGEGKGATFIVSLPARSAIPAVSGGVRPAKAPEPIAGAVGAPQLDGLRVLVIDDEDDARDLVGSVLEQHGAEVHCAPSALSGLERLATVKPDVIVSDIGMPHMDGYALIRKIRGLPPELGGRTPAVALTAYARLEDAQRAFAAGYQMHVTKPVEPVELATVVANLGGRSMGDG